MAVAVIFTAIFFIDRPALHGSAISAVFLAYSGIALWYLWDYDKLRTLSHLAAEYAQLAEAAEQESKELQESNKKAVKFLGDFEEENKQLKGSLETLKTQAGLIDATQEELDRIEGQMDQMIDAQERLAVLEKSLNRENAIYLLRVKQDEYDQRRHRALNQVMEAFEDVDNRDRDG